MGLFQDLSHIQPDQRQPDIAEGKSFLELVDADNFVTRKETECTSLVYRILGSARQEPGSTVSDARFENRDYPDMYPRQLVTLLSAVICSYEGGGAGVAAPRGLDGRTVREKLVPRVHPQYPEHLGGPTAILTAENYDTPGSHRVPSLMAGARVHAFAVWTEGKPGKGNVEKNGKMGFVNVTYQAAPMDLTALEAGFAPQHCFAGDPKLSPEQRTAVQNAQAAPAQAPAQAPQGWQPQPSAPAQAPAQAPQGWQPQPTQAAPAQAPAQAPQGWQPQPTQAAPAQAPAQAPQGWQPQPTQAAPVQQAPQGWQPPPVAKDDIPF